jgi:hypothetical protein
MFKRTLPWKEAALTFIISRLVILVVTYLAVAHFPIKGAPPYNCLLNNSYYCVTAWRHWDSGNYARIAFNGYSTPDLTAFFPLWPKLVHIATFIVLGDHLHSSAPTFVMGLILTNVFFYFALVLFYCLVSKDFEPSIARESLFYLALSPYALFFFAPYTESLFLFLCLAFFLALRQDKAWSWWLAGACGFLASLTRGTGFILVLPYLIFLVQRFWPDRTEWRSLLPRILNAALPMALIPAGLLAYMTYLYIKTGNPMAFSTQELVYFQRSTSFPWTPFIHLRTQIHTPDVFNDNIADLAFTIIPITILVLGWRRLPLHYNIFVLTTMLFSLAHSADTTRPLLSIPRYLMLVTFPLFVTLALWSKKSPMLGKALTALSFTFFVTNIALFVTMQWVA